MQTAIYQTNNREHQRLSNPNILMQLSNLGESVSPIKIMIFGINNDDDIIKLFNSFKNDFSTKFIKVKRAEKGCIIIFAEVKIKAIYEATLFVKEVTGLIRTVFNMCKLTCDTDQITYAVITSAEGINDNFTFDINISMYYFEISLLVKMND